MKIFNAYKVCASGLTAQRKRINAIIENIANANSSSYKCKKVVQRTVPVSQKFQTLVEKAHQLATTNPNHIKHSSSKHTSSVTVNTVQTKVFEDENRFKIIYDKNHPDADENGYVKLPDINIVTEMANLLLASRAFEANITALNAAKAMDKKALDI